ncbi:hypothetical protein [Stakelama pacifica]|uniref:Uncharacterized protein n=1 Tax=Stakelama pacifica TaxID=517720 RepID=A0A4R6FPW7_9SPHN|nr:hypothetical protein [Stakelama pacifica]TDN83537.1 hypothetical protein EV664_10420 [Stakelama pacifica]GGO94107.1 hypothetical protein GCM10011329_15100 [Stakelama pacifica]
MSGSESNLGWDHAASRTSAADALVKIAAARPAQLAARETARRSKLPFKAALYRDSLLWRTEELGRSALGAYDRDDHVAGIVLTRATIETIAALNSLHRLVTRYQGGGIDTLDATLMSMLMGSRVRDDRPDAINILNAVDKLTKTLPAFRALYDQLSEYAHPNDAGTASSFAILNTVPLGATFAARGEQYERRAWLMIECLAASLMLVMPLYVELVDAGPAFARQCDADVDGT